MEILLLLSRIAEEQAGDGSGVDLLNGLEAGYEFEDSLLDVTGNGHDLVDRSGGTDVQFVDGLAGKAARFSGVQHNFLAAPAHADLLPGNDWTIAVEFKYTNFDTDFFPYLFGLTGGEAEFDEWVLWIDNGQAALGHTPPTLANEAHYPNMTAEVITTDQWYFVVGWKEGNKIYHQVNGGTVIEAAAPDPFVVADPTAGLVVGNYNFVSGDLGFWVGADFDGDIGCCFYWPDRALSAQERVALWNGGTRKQYPFS